MGEEVNWWNSHAGFPYPVTQVFVTAGRLSRTNYCDALEGNL